MKLNPECIRAILEAYEDLPAINDNFDLGIAKYPDDVLYFHQIILEEAGYIKCKKIGTSSDPYTIFPERITFQGLEFLNTARNEEGWGKVRKASSKVGGFVLSLAAEFLKEQAKIKMASLL